MSTVYIHYGSNKFDKARFKPIENRSWPGNKPEGDTGLWASRVDDKDGWKNWCIYNEFHLDALNESFTFSLKEGAKVLFLYTDKDLDALPDATHNGKEWFVGGSKAIDFEKCVKLGIDAIELMDCYELYTSLYGWDCDSILILNPDIVVPV